MLFNSLGFIFLFLPLTVISYFLINKYATKNFAKIFLIIASGLFYGRRNPVYLLLIIGSVIFNYFLGRELLSSKKKSFLIFGIVVNIGLLGYFKYADFFIENVNAILSAQIPLLNIILPLAISFFTFQQIAYITDSYQGKTKQYNFMDYILFVTFFPQLIAGPIVHHDEMMPQFEDEKNSKVNYKNMMIGLFLFTLGLFKKTVIADTFAEWATHGFDVTETLTFIDGWITSLSYTIQLYFDFSGYTDMALGIALLFNIVLPFNFDSPYKSLDIQDFWRRRHITLSRFLKDYIYIPLGGNRKGVSRTYVNLMLTFIIGGIWHGAGRTFIFWGLLHGGALCLHRYWKKSGSSMPNLFGRFLTFNFVNIAWIFFRALERGDALKVLQGMFGLSGFGEINTDIMYKIGLIILVLGLSIYGYNTNKIHDVEFKSYRYPIGFALLFLASLLAMSLIEHSEFIYFNF